MSYFSGFGFEGEEPLFEEFVQKGRYNLSGFSYGAQKALEHALSSLERLQILQLFSPAFFQTQSAAFKKAQRLAFIKDASLYHERFLSQSVEEGDVEKIRPYFRGGTLEELEALLAYEWKREKFEALLERGVRVEVYLGERDGIINAKEALEFFQTLPVTIFWLKNRHHFLFSASSII